MNGYEFSDYGIFSNAISTTNTLKTKATDCNNAVNEANTTLSNNDVFMGPIADECLQAINSLTTDLTNIEGNFEKISSYLAQTSNEYKISDQNASNVVNNGTELQLKNVSTTGNRNELMRQTAEELAAKNGYAYVSGGGWGANPNTHTGGYDCGLFVSAVLEVSGLNPAISLENTNIIQAQGGNGLLNENLLLDNGWSKHPYSSMAELTGGDIVFNGHHVVMYNGDGTMNHASSPERGIVINDNFYGSDWSYYYHYDGANT